MMNILEGESVAAKVKILFAFIIQHFISFWDCNNLFSLLGLGLRILLKLGLLLLLGVGLLCLQVMF